MSENLHERAARLRERIEQGYADPWDFKELPELVGVVESYARVDTAYGARVVCTIVEPTSDSPDAPAPRRYAVWLSSTALLNRFRELRPMVGELVAIRYLGQSDPAERGRQPAHRFRVEVDRPGSTFEWASLEADDEPVLVVDREHDRVAHERAVDAAREERPPPPTDDDIPF